MRANAPDTNAVLRQQNLNRILNPRSIAVVGASADPGKAGSQAIASLRDFPGTLVAVHPRETEIQGFPCYPSVTALPEPVDLAILAIPAKFCVQAAREAAARGVGGIFIISGGFAETGEDGMALQNELAAICDQSGMRLLGPNTSGFINPHVECTASFVPGVDKLRKGRIAVVAQSGGVNLTLAFLLDRLGEGISLAVGLGNAVDIGSADVLAMLAEDENTAAIALHLEGVTQGRQLFDTLKLVTRRKPVIALIAGKADVAEFAVSHTGNLMGSYQRTAAALTQAGAVVVDTTDELVQAAAILADGRLAPRAECAFGVVTGQAGPGLLIVDGLKTAGLSVPYLGDETCAAIERLLPPLTFVKNPVDTGRPGPSFPEVVRLVAADKKISATLVYGISEPAVLQPEVALKPAVEAGHRVIFGTAGLVADIESAAGALRTIGVSTVFSPERLVLAARCLAADARGQWRLEKDELTAVGHAIPIDGALSEAAAKQFLGQYGIPSPASMPCNSIEEAAAAFAKLRKPVVAKILADDIAHKTEAGGVHLNLRSEAELRAAADAIMRIPAAGRVGILVEEMATGGVELIVGGVRDPSWGPCVMVGIGGVTAEALGDSSVRLAPVSADDVGEMLDGLRGRKLLDGFRHLPVCDRGKISAVVMAIGRILLEHPEIAEIEINPLRVTQDGPIALDALIVTTNRK